MDQEISGGAMDETQHRFNECFILDLKRHTTDSFENAVAVFNIYCQTDYWQKLTEQDQ